MSLNRLMSTRNSPLCIYDRKHIQDRAVKPATKSSVSLSSKENVPWFGNGNTVRDQAVKSSPKRNLPSSSKVNASSVRGDRPAVLVPTKKPEGNAGNLTRPLAAAPRRLALQSGFLNRPRVKRALGIGERPAPGRGTSGSVGDAAEARRAAAPASVGTAAAAHPRASATATTIPFVAPAAAAACTAAAGFVPGDGVASAAVPEGRRPGASDRLAALGYAPATTGIAAAVLPTPSIAIAPALLPLSAAAAACSVPGTGAAPPVVLVGRRPVYKARQTFTTAKRVVWMLVLLLLPLVNTSAGVGSTKVRTESSASGPFTTKLHEQRKLTAEVLQDALEHERQVEAFARVLAQRYAADLREQDDAATEVLRESAEAKAKVRAGRKLRRKKTRDEAQQRQREERLAEQQQREEAQRLAESKAAAERAAQAQAEKEAREEEEKQERERQRDLAKRRAEEEIVEEVLRVDKSKGKGYRYRVLGLPMGAPYKDLKEGFDRRAKKVHPDKNKSAKAAEAFRAVHGAFKDLKNYGPEQYERYRKKFG